MRVVEARHLELVHAEDLAHFPKLVLGSFLELAVRALLKELYQLPLGDARGPEQHRSADSGHPWFERGAGRHNRDRSFDAGPVLKPANGVDLTAAIDKESRSHRRRHQLPAKQPPDQEHRAAERPDRDENHRQRLRHRDGFRTRPRKGGGRDGRERLTDRLDQHHVRPPGDAEWSQVELMAEERQG